MKNLDTLMSTAISAVVAIGMLTAASTQAAEKDKAAKPEKCYSVVKAGKNDCQTANSACAGTSTKDGQKDAWIYLPKGTCEKIVGASLNPKK